MAKFSFDEKERQDIHDIRKFIKYHRVSAMHWSTELEGLIAGMLKRVGYDINKMDDKKVDIDYEKNTIEITQKVVKPSGADVAKVAKTRESGKTKK